MMIADCRQMPGRDDALDAGFSRARYTNAEIKAASAAHRFSRALSAGMRRFAYHESYHSPLYRPPRNDARQGRRSYHYPWLRVFRFMHLMPAAEMRRRFRQLLQSRARAIAGAFADVEGLPLIDIR